MREKMLEVAALLREKASGFQSVDRIETAAAVVGVAQSIEEVFNAPSRVPADLDETGDDRSTVAIHCCNCHRDHDMTYPRDTTALIKCPHCGNTALQLMKGKDFDGCKSGLNCPRP